MEVKRGMLSRGNVAHATGRGKRYVEDALEAAKNLASDTQKKERVEKGLCLSCFYLFKQRMGGAAITNRQCAGCETVMRFSSTATDLLCKPCANANALCCRCGADIGLKDRRKPYLFQANGSKW